MSLTLEGGTKGGIPTGMPGVYINDAIIAGVQDISGSMPTGFKTPIDLGIELELEIGRSFRPKLRLFGNFKTTAAGEKTWGGAFKLRDFFRKAGCKGSLGDDNKIPKEWLDSLIGKKIWRLSYVSRIRPDGKLGYSDWNEVWMAEEDPEKMAASFKTQFLKSGYPKNYNADLLESVGGATFDPAELDAPAPPPTGL